MLTTLDDTVARTSSASHDPSLDMDDFMGFPPPAQLGTWDEPFASDEILKTHGPPDEPAAFVFHLNRDAVPEASRHSPTQITSTLTLTPTSKRAKPNTSRSKAPPKAKRAKNAAPAADAPAAAPAADATPPAAAEEIPETPETPKTPDFDHDNSSEPSEAPPAADAETEEDAAAADGTPPADVDAAEDKRMQRMMRNRASAAESRKRKRKQMEEYETLVKTLHERVAELERQNSELRKACALASGKGQPPPLEVPPPPPPPANSAACA